MKAPEQWQPGVNPWLIALTMVLPTFMVALDTSVANVALPHIAGSLSASTDEATWVLTSYLVTNAIVLPITDWLATYLGRKFFLILSITAFTLSSALCGAALTLGMLIFARVVQGASGGALLPVSQAVLLESFPPAQRGEAMAAYGLGVIFAPIIGPTLGGWITDTASWRWVFYINVPVGILAVLMTSAFIEDPPYLKGRMRGTIDYVGFFLMAIGLGTLQVILDKGERNDWFAAQWIRWVALISLCSLVGFFLWERRAKHPIVNLQVLTNRNLAVGILLAAVYGVILYGSLVMLPLFLQNLMGYPALQSGLAITPRGIGALFSMTLAGRLVRRVDGRFLIITGYLGLAWAGFLLGDINLQISMISVVIPNIMIGASMGFIFVPLTTIAMGMLPNEQMGAGTGLYNLMRNLGGSIGIAFVSTMLARDAQLHQALMVSHLSPSDPAFQDRLHSLRQLFLARGDIVTATREAYGAIYRIVVQQSTLCAFVDTFRLLGYVSLVGVPLTFLFRKDRETARPRTSFAE